MQLSILTINFNNLLGLQKTYTSLLSQKKKDFEWIIIDGGSTDGSKELIEATAVIPDSNISYWCSEKDKGIYNALNKGIKHCHGEYICCMNSGDVFYDENTLDNVFDYQHKADILYGDALFKYEDHSEIRIYPEKLSFRWLYNDTLNHQATFCRTKILKKFLFDESFRIMADRKLWLQLYMNGYSFEHLPIIVTRYDHTGISATNGKKWCEEFKRLHNEIIPPIVQKIRPLEIIYKLIIEIRSKFK